jgi:hypothetical protein
MADNDQFCKQGGKYIILITYCMKKRIENIPDEQFPGYPTYPEDEDIYSKGQVEEEVDPDNPSEIKASMENPKAPNEKSFAEDSTGEDLDIPGAEIDDDQEYLGSEDEENNYYSLGGDNHESLEEDRGGD